MIKQLQGTLVFVQIQTPVDCWEKEKGKEYKASIVVDEDTADAWNEAYPKQTAKVVKTADFEEIYKIPPPAEFEDQKKQYIITVRKNTKLANGEPVPEKYRPRVMEKEGNTRLDVTNTKIPANGSVGIISIDHYEGKMGPVGRLQNVLVTSMIEYEGGSGKDYVPGDEFDEGTEEEKPVSKKQEAKAEKPKKAAKPTAEDDNDQDPF